MTPSLAKPGPARPSQGPETIEFYYHFWPFETCVGGQLTATMETLPPTCSPPDLPRPVVGHTAVWLPTGLLVCGGTSTSYSDVTSVCHHWSNGTWEPAQAMG